MCKTIERFPFSKKKNPWRRLRFANMKFLVCYLGAEMIDPDDPTYIAENELINAAQSIESAAKKLAVLKPRQKPKVNL